MLLMYYWTRYWLKEKIKFFSLNALGMHLFPTNAPVLEWAHLFYSTFSMLFISASFCYHLCIRWICLFLQLLSLYLCEFIY
jgi:hypothetical protein